jgi:hypothetical protein
LQVNQTINISCRVLSVDGNGRPTSIDVGGTTNSACTGLDNHADGFFQNTDWSDGGWYARFGGFLFLFSAQASVNDTFSLTLTVTAVDGYGKPTSIESTNCGGLVWTSTNGLVASFAANTTNGTQSYAAPPPDGGDDGTWTIEFGQSTTAVVD